MKILDPKSSENRQLNQLSVLTKKIEKNGAVGETRANEVVSRKKVDLVKTL
jgi:hypothetical protein